MCDPFLIRLEPKRSHEPAAENMHKTGHQRGHHNVARREEGNMRPRRKGALGAGAQVHDNAKRALASG